MIYKFIDNNDSEITVNSLSSLQALVDSQTVKEDTKVKAGLRGKWTTASNIEGLTFYEEAAEEADVTVAPEGDIKSGNLGVLAKFLMCQLEAWIGKGKFFLEVNNLFNEL